MFTVFIKVRRKTSQAVIGRMYPVSPRDLERFTSLCLYTFLFHILYYSFYLRLLLLHCRGCTSFEDLRTVDGVVSCTSQISQSHLP